MKPVRRSVAASRPGDAATSQRARAYQGFTQQILSGGIRSGQFISQRELMALLDMPLGAVREMIPRLEAGGLIKTVPQRGLQIAHVDLKLIRNAFQVRGMIEREAIAHFARSASDTDLEAIETRHRDILRRASALQAATADEKTPGRSQVASRALAGAGKAGAGGADTTLLDEAQALDWGLHDTLVDALGNEIISEIYRVNTLRVRLIRLEHSVITPARLVPAMQEHLAFIAALRQRDVETAVRLLEAHIQSARQRVMASPLEGLDGVAPTPASPAKPVRASRAAAPAPSTP